ncbi:unnamed protein product [Owenia fusiformis]|uniref:Uncharacterized protein n=1 Tax=Owenia fusiformis TaxID=6347 RepID=A0A8J1UL03_OWEFU|nr:unnamed protein product [Owenia fusiformis]
MGKKLDLEMEYSRKRRRENQLLFIYIFVGLSLLMAWKLGEYSFSIIWIFGLVGVVFVVWWARVLRLTEEHLKFYEVLLHRKKALGRSESAEWLNFVINRWWVFSSPTIADLLKRHLDPVLSNVKPAFVDQVELDKFSLGEQTPYIKYVRAFENADGIPEGTTPVSWLDMIHPPNGLSMVSDYQIGLVIDIGVLSEDFVMVFNTRMSKKFMGMSIPIAIEKLHLEGQLQLILHMSMDTPFPHISKASISFLEKPDIWFNVRALKSIDLMEVPILKSWMHNLVMDSITSALVDPGKVQMKLGSTGPTYRPTDTNKKKLGQGALKVTILNKPVEGKKFLDDIHYCQLKLGEDKENTSSAAADSSWASSHWFLVRDRTTEQLCVKVKSKRMLSTLTLAQFDLPLTNYPLRQQQVVNTDISKEVTTMENTGLVNMEVALEYTEMPPIDLDKMVHMEDDAITDEKVSGVLYVCVHGAAGLLGLDQGDTSDPYCIIFNNGKKMKTTHYVPRTKSPVWNCETEFFVEDVSKTLMSFIVYDWDGKGAGDDDFLGSAYLPLSKENSCFVKHPLTLGYNMLAGKKSEKYMGAITVSVIFRYVPSGSDIALDHGLEAPRMPSFRSTSSSPYGTLPNQGILEVGIIRARNLVSMDMNGFSDPFVEVAINDKKKYTSAVKKKTLVPAWDEVATLTMPSEGDTLEIKVWDKDFLITRDFMGSVKFTYADIQEQSKKDGPQWHTLQETKKGEILLSFKVIQDEIDAAGEDAVFAELKKAMTPPTSRKSINNNIEEETESCNGSPVLKNVNPTLKDIGRSKTEPPVDYDKISSQPSSPEHLQVPSQKLPRSSSDANLKEDTLRSRFTSLYSINSNFTDDLNSEKYYHVYGKVIQARGIYDTIQGEIYCKVRLDSKAKRRNYSFSSRSSSQRKSSRFSPGKVLEKSENMRAVPMPNFNLEFEVDQGRGVSTEALLIIDIKNTPKEHVSTKGFTLKFLFGDDDKKKITRWVALENGIEVELFLSRDEPAPDTWSDANPKPIGSPFKAFKRLSLGR